MRQWYVGKFCLRVFSRPNWLWPYFSRRYMPACFGFGYWGVMVMRQMTREEAAMFKRGVPPTEGHPK